MRLGGLSVPAVRSAAPAAPKIERRGSDIRSEVAVLITATAVAAAIVLVVTAESTISTFAAQPEAFISFVALAFLLQLFSVEVYGGGRIGVSVVGMLACGFVLGAGPAMAVAATASLIQFARARRFLHRAVFDMAQWTLATGAAVVAFHAVTRLSDATSFEVVAALVAGLSFVVINNLLLCAAIGLSESKPLRGVWEDRFRWARYHYVAIGPLALACSLAYESIGVVGLVAFAVPPGLVLVSVRQYVEKTRAAADEVQRANTELERSIRDANDLYEFSRGLAAQPHDRTAIFTYAEASITELAGARAAVVSSAQGVDEIRAGETVLGSIVFSASETFDSARWARLRDAVLPQLATAIENADLAAKVRKTHLDTIAALSRSMEAKDYYTGGHTERVAEIAVALAERLGFSGADLDAVEVGAMLHDIGKIGIPERILHKPGPLDDEEWAVMKEHPVISDYILSGVDLPSIVRRIARSSHERIDGAGYPDALSSDEIPLEARIVLVADAFDALTSDRPYRPARHTVDALSEIHANAGSQFCPRVVEALDALYRERPSILGGHLRVAEVA